MPSRRFALERGGPKRLRARWRRGPKDFEIAFDDAAPWRLDPASLSTGASLVLPDGSSLLVSWIKRRWWWIGRDELRLERDGVPVPGSDGDPRVIGRGAGSLLLLFGFLRFVLLWAWSSLQPAVDVGSLVVLDAAALAVLGILAALGLRLPVLLGAVLLVAETLGAVASGMRVNPLGLLVQALVVVHLFRAFGRMRPRPRQPSVPSVFE